MSSEAIRYTVRIQDSSQTQFKNVVRFRKRIATQQRRYAAGPNSRTITAPCRRTSLVVMTPLIAISAPRTAVLGALLAISVPPIERLLPCRSGPF
jgi:hypothetical protein